MVVTATCLFYDRDLSCPTSEVNLKVAMKVADTSRILSAKFYIHLVSLSYHLLSIQLPTSNKICIPPLLSNNVSAYSPPELLTGSFFSYATVFERIPIKTLLSIYNKYIGLHCFMVSALTCLSRCLPSTFH